MMSSIVSSVVIVLSSCKSPSAAMRWGHTKSPVSYLTGLLLYCLKFCWASRESNTAPTDYESIEHRTSRESISLIIKELDLMSEEQNDRNQDQKRTRHASHRSDSDRKTLPGNSNESVHSEQSWT